MGVLVSQTLLFSFARNNLDYGISATKSLPSGWMLQKPSNPHLHPTQSRHPPLLTFPGRCFPPSRVLCMYINVNMVQYRHLSALQLPLAFTYHASQQTCEQSPPFSLPPYSYLFLSPNPSTPSSLLPSLPLEEWKWLPCTIGLVEFFIYLLVFLLHNSPYLCLPR